MRVNLAVGTAAWYRSMARRKTNKRIRGFHKGVKATSSRALGAHPQEVRNFDVVRVGQVNNTTQSSTAGRSFWGFLDSAISRVTPLFMESERRKTAEAQAAIESLRFPISPDRSTAVFSSWEQMALIAGGIGATILLLRRK